MWYGIGIVAVALIIWYVVKKRSSSGIPANPLEQYLNQEAVVTESISDTLGSGKINIDGQEIQARKGATGVINIGTKVIITGVGTHMVTVKPIE